MTLDVRTRFDGQSAVFEAAKFLGETLPSRLATHAELIPPSSELELRPLVIHVEDRAWLLRRDRERFEVTPLVPDPGSTSVDPVIERLASHDRIAEVRLSGAQLGDLVEDQVTPVGLMTAGTLDQPRGRIGHLLDWWLVMRSVLDVRPIHRRGAVVLPEDLRRSFTLEDDPDDLFEFLESAGFLHLRGVFSAEEMAAVSTEMDAASSAYEPDDANSWWATLADGTPTVVRMQRFDEHSPTAASILADDRLARIAAIGRCGHAVDWAASNRIEALFKPIGVTAGISDVPWHKDCSLGRHSYECCSLTVGISVTGAGPTSGQLRVVAGSHRALIWPSLLDTSTIDLPEVELPTETGDVTVHLSCTLHMAQPPTVEPRRVLYTGLRLPSLVDDTARRTASRRLQATSREGAPRHTSQPSTA